MHRRSICTGQRQVFRQRRQLSRKLPAICAVFAFTMQIYFDFSGYSDIAIGCRAAVRIRVSREFHSAVPCELDRGFLASLAHHAVDVAARLRIHSARRKQARQFGDVKNLMLTMLLGGLVARRPMDVCGMGSVSRHLVVARAAGEDLASPPRARGVSYYARVAFTFVLVSLGWVLFRASGFAAAGETYKAIFREAGDSGYEPLADGLGGLHRSVRHRSPDYGSL